MKTVSKPFNPQKGVTPALLFDEGFRNICNIFCTQIFAALVFLTATYCFYHPNGAQLCITASPHPPVMELSLLQQVLVASKALFLIANPAAVKETCKGLNSILTH